MSKHYPQLCKYCNAPKAANMTTCWRCGHSFRPWTISQDQWEQIVARRQSLGAKPIDVPRTSN